MTTLTSGKYIFEIVDELPMGYVIWNIGRRNFPFEGYIPLCQIVCDYNINPNTLKALKVKNEEFALKLMDLNHRKRLTNYVLKKIIEEIGV